MLFMVLFRQIYINIFKRFCKKKTLHSILKYKYGKRRGTNYWFVLSKTRSIKFFYN